MKTVALISQKGGVGKTSLTLGLAVEAERRGRKVAVVDLDPQTTAASWGDRRGKRPAVVSCQVARLPQVLAAAEAEGVDLVLIDTPGKAAESSIAAARASDLVLLPIQPMLFDIETLSSLKDLLSLAGDPPAEVVLNRCPVQGRRHVEARDGIVNLYGLEVAPPVIFSRAAVGDAGNLGLTAAELDPEGKAGREIMDLYSHIVILLKGARHHGKAKQKQPRRGA